MLVTEFQSYLLSLMTQMLVQKGALAQLYGSVPM